MYLYFDKNGTLKEWINDEPLRQGSSGINYVYVFCEKMVDNTNLTGLWTRYRQEGTYLPSSTTYYNNATLVTGKVPYSKERDLKFFKYFTDYKFYKFKVADDVLALEGAWLMSCWLCERISGVDTITTLGEMAFNVDESTFSVKIDENINVAQWNALIGEINDIRTETLKKELYEVVYEETTFAEIEDALENGKIPYLYYTNQLEDKILCFLTIGYMDQDGINRYKFVAMDSDVAYEIIVRDDNEWFTNELRLNEIYQDVLDKTTSLSEDSTDTEYPSAKAVYDAIQDIDVPNKQTTTSIVRNALTNVNGWVLTAFTSNLTTISGYTAYQILKGGNILTEEDASRYMEDMTGSKFLPKYDYFKPQNTYFIFADKSIWKPQYDETNGLLLYKVSEIKSGTQLYKHTLTDTNGNGEIFIFITDNSTPIVEGGMLDYIVSGIIISMMVCYYDGSDGYYWCSGHAKNNAGNFAPSSTPPSTPDTHIEGIYYSYNHYKSLPQGMTDVVTEL